MFLTYEIDLKNDTSERPQKVWGINLPCTCLRHQLGIHNKEISVEDWSRITDGANSQWWEKEGKKKQEERQRARERQERERKRKANLKQISFSDEIDDMETGNTNSTIVSEPRPSDQCGMSSCQRDHWEISGGCEIGSNEAPWVYPFVKCKKVVEHKKRQLENKKREEKERETRERERDSEKDVKSKAVRLRDKIDVSTG